MRAIAVLNQKGGVGKTTISVNLSCALSNLGKRVLLVDLDPQSNATLSLTPKLSSKGNIYTLLSGENTIDESISVINNKLNFIPSCVELAGIEHELTPETLNIIRDKFSVINNYDYVIFDCAPSLGLLVLSCLTYVNEVFIPVQPEFFALNGLTQLTATVNRVKQQLNPAIRISGIIFSMYQARRVMTRDIVNEIQNYFQDVIFKTRIRPNVKLVEAQSHGRSIFEYDPDSAGAADFLGLAREVVKQELQLQKEQINQPEVSLQRSA